MTPEAEKVLHSIDSNHKKCWKCGEYFSIIGRSKVWTTCLACSKKIIDEHRKEKLNDSRS